MKPVVLTTVRNEIEAEMICGPLRCNGIKCNEELSAYAFRSTLGSDLSRDVFVAPEDLDAARRLLESR